MNKREWNEELMLYGFIGVIFLCFVLWLVLQRDAEMIIHNQAVILEAISELNISSG